MQSSKLRRTEKRSALVQLDFIWDTKLFAEPGDALGLGVLEVVYKETHCRVLRRQ